MIWLKSFGVLCCLLLMTQLASASSEVFHLDGQTWLEEHPLPENKDIVASEVWRNAHASAHVVQIQTREPLHKHERHTLLVVVEKGAGILHLGEKTLALDPGDMVTIPAGEPHAFVCTSKVPAVAYVVFTPPYDGEDNILISEVGT